MLPPIPVYRAHSHIFLIVSDAANYAVCDYTKRFAHCTLTPGALADRGWLLFYFLDALVYSLLAQLYTVPVHAACVSRSGRGVLLCGPSGAGKSSLAFACASREWTYVSDDASHVVRGRRDRLVVGRPSVFRFRESASDLFPELQGRPAERDGLGKMTMEVRTRDLRGIRTAASARVHHIVFLDRHAASPERLFRVDAAEALTRLWSVQHGFDPALREGQEACLRHLLETGSYGLRYRRLDAAVSMLEQLVVEGGPL